jgi:hypothetical protein
MELDRRLVNTTRLRTGRLAALARLQADVASAVGDSVPVHLIADGPADYSSGGAGSRVGPKHEVP